MAQRKTSLKINYIYSKYLIKIKHNCHMPKSLSRNGYCTCFYVNHFFRQDTHEVFIELFNNCERHRKTLLKHPSLFIK